MQQCDLLAACQVDQVKFPRQLHLRLHVLLLDVDQKDAVTARAVLVHVCRKQRDKYVNTLNTDEHRRENRLQHEHTA